MKALSLTALIGVLSIAQAQAPPLWAIGAESRLGFTTTLQGNKVVGTFEDFNARILFDAGNLSDSEFTVTVIMASVSTRVTDRDMELKGPDLFDVEQYPQAQFHAAQFRHIDAEHFEAVGDLTIRDQTHQITLPFSFTASGTAATLTGEVTISRLDYGVGQGEWAGTEWIGEEVIVDFSLSLSR